MRLIGKLGWAARVLAAVLVGAVWRFLRRLARRRPRIWHGFRPLHVTRNLVRADRLHGFPSRSVVDRAELLRYALIRPEHFDRVLSEPGVAHDTLHWRAMIDLHLHGDIWSAHFDCHFFPWSQRRRNRLALAIVRAAGIRILVCPHGSDVLQLGIPSHYGWVERMQLDYPTWDLREQTQVSRERIELFTRYASIVFAAEPATARLLTRSDFLFPYFAVECGGDAAALKAAAQLPHSRIVHAPNHRHVKGTDFLIAAIERVRAAGFNCELVLVEKVPHEEAMEIYRTADIIADQFCIGGFGVFALEAMSLGKPVLVYLEETLELPLVNTTPENLTRVLAAMLAIPELRARIGEASRVAAERYHSLDAIGEVWGRMHRHVWRGEPLALETTRHFSRTRRVLSEDPAAENFWPVDVSDLMQRIADAIRLV